MIDAERLAAIRAHADIGKEYAAAHDSFVLSRMTDHVYELLAEVERLRLLAHDEHVIGQAFVDRINELEQQNAAMREIVQAVALGCTMAIRPNATWCAACLCLDNTDGEWSDSPHDADCCVTKARAILATEQQRTEVRGEPPAE